MELMAAGRAPFIMVTDSEGNARLVQAELHHITGRETLRGNDFFSGSEMDGALIEIASTVHDDFDRQLHIGNPSFRRDGDGRKTQDAAQYEKFRAEYWKHRAKKFRGP